jgi:Uri superfamily endonuclease
LSETKGSMKKGLKGIYILVVQLSGDIKVYVGALGEMSFAKGLYAYVGSAQINMEQRIKRHLRSEKRKFWHIDYLIDNPAVKVIKVFLKEGKKAEECKTAKRLSRKSAPVAGFGCSDCNCKSHLFHIKNYEFIQETMQVFPKET